MRWDYAPLDINPVLPGLGEIIIIVIIIIIINNNNNNMLQYHKTNVKKKLKTLKTLWLLFWMGFNYLKATATSMRPFAFYHSVPRNFWYST